MILVLAGDIEIQKILESIDKHISSDRNLGIIERHKIAEPESRVKEFTEQKLVVSQQCFR